MFKVLNHFTLSPTIENYQMSLSTIEYAIRANNIENKTVINCDPMSKEITEVI